MTLWPSARSVFGSAARDVGEAADLDERRELGGDEEDLHRAALLPRRRRSRAMRPWAACARDPRSMTRIRASTKPSSSAPTACAEGSVVTVFRVPPEVAGQRLDVFLQSQLKRTSRTRTQFIVRTSAYDDRGQAPPPERPRPGRAARSSSGARRGTRTPVPTDVPILYEDEHLFAVDKPAHLPVHPTARYHKNTLIKVLKARAPGRVPLARPPHRSRDERRAPRREERRVRSRAEEAARGARRHREDATSRITWGVPDAAATARAPFRFERSVELDPDEPLPR